MGHVAPVAEGDGHSRRAPPSRRVHQADTVAVRSMSGLHPSCPVHSRSVNVRRSSARRRDCRFLIEGADNPEADARGVGRRRRAIGGSQGPCVVVLAAAHYVSRALGTGARAAVGRHALIARVPTSLTHSRPSGFTYHQFSTRDFGDLLWSVPTNKALSSLRE